MAVAKTYQDQLDRIKKNVKDSYLAFKPNYDRFNEFRRFIFETSLTQDDITLLVTQSKPQLEFNISEAYISRLMGEFSKQEPSIEVSSEDEEQADPTTVHVVESHIRHALLDKKNNHVRWEVMKEIYSGGFSVGKVTTDYANPMSFNQVIVIDKAYDPCMCGFDQMARLAHKGDGKFSFELTPYTLEKFKDTYPHINIDKVSFNRSFAGFNWSYLNGNEKILLVADYYEKKERRVQIVQLADNKVMKMDDYKELLESWQDMAPPPAIKGKPRWTSIETIARYICVETEVIEYEETDYTMLPHVFFDGNSIMLRNPKTSGAVGQMTRPYVYHAKGAQKLKNFAGICLANELENTVQHKFMIAKEALPKEADWLAAYKDVQKPSNLVFNAFYEGNPEQPIANPIREVQRVQTPPEVIATFTGTDSLIQNILGSYDASLGINDNQLSGVAIIEAATQSNAAAMPYVVGFLQGLQRIAEIMVDLIPKYYKTPRTIPVMGVNGKADYVKINQDNGVDMYYDTNVLNVKVEAGVSFQIQKSRALQQLIALQQASPLFAQFMNEKGLSVLLDNIEIRGIDQLKLMVEDWQKELQAQKQQAMQAQQQEAMNNPQIIKAQTEQQKIQQQAQQSQADNQLKMLELKQDASEASQDFMLRAKELELEEKRLKQDMVRIFADMQESKTDTMTERMKAETERYSKQVDLAMQRKDMHHRHFKEAIETHHKIHSARAQFDLEKHMNARQQHH